MLARIEQEIGVSGMLFRALFWIALVAFLMPHEPDLGFGRPGAPANAHSRAALDGSERFLASLRTVALRNLDQVRADLIANGHPL
jgi:hypothetical protein